MEAARSSGMNDSVARASADTAVREEPPRAGIVETEQIREDDQRQLRDHDPRVPREALDEAAEPTLLVA